LIRPVGGMVLITPSLSHQLGRVCSMSEDLVVEADLTNLPPRDRPLKLMLVGCLPRTSSAMPY
jgi:hypothetical protein